MKINTMKLKLTALLLVLYTGLYAQNKIVLTAPRLDTSSLSNRINLKANTNLNNVNGVLSSTYGGAGSVSGILKADGSGVVSPVIASDITTLISGTYLPLSGGTLTGALNGTSAAFSGAGGVDAQKYTLGTYTAIGYTGLALQLGSTVGSQFTATDMYANGSFSSRFLSGKLLINTTTDNGTDALQVAGSAYISSTLYLSSSIFNSNSTYLDIYNNTTDGSDTKITRIGGGGDVNTTRGAFIDLRGNEAATGAGNLYLNAGGSGTIIANATLNGTSLSMSGLVKSATHLSVGGQTSPLYSEQLTVGVFNTPKITYAQTGGYRWSTLVDNLGDAKFRVRYEEGAIEPLIIDRLGNVALMNALNGTSLSMSGNGFFGGTSMASISNPRALIIQNPAGTDFVLGIKGGTTTGSSYGPFIQAGTNSSDISLLVRDVNNVTDYLKIRGNGVSSFSENLLIKTTTDNGTDALQVAGSGLFTGTLNANSAGSQISIGGGATRAGIFMSSGSSLLKIADWATGNVGLTMNLSTGAITASSSVTANSFVKSGGTSSQFLKADGSVDGSTYITSASVGNGTLTLNVSGSGLSGSQSFTANQSGNATFTVTSNATTAATASTIAYRDGSGNLTAAGFFESSTIKLKDVFSRDGDVAYFKWKDRRDDRLHIGYIAEEKLKTNPDQVKKDENGYLSVNYTEILVQKLRDLEKKLEKLEKKLKTNSKKLKN